MRATFLLILGLTSMALTAALPVPDEAAELGTDEGAQDDDTVIIYVYQASGDNRIQAPGSSGADDDDAVAYP
ncbi:hypothetical protein F5X98DRAFT_337828 [Xylaria grammica]|nr:hypothetical protein F5X98DRAFT_337828 [Xylaria grammica]